MSGLSDFDINDIDFNNMGSWPAVVKALFLVVIFAVVIAGFYYFDTQKQLDQLAAEESKEPGLKKEFEAQWDKAVNLEKYRQQMKDMEARFGQLLKQLPKKTEVDGLLEDLSYSQTASNLQERKITLNQEVKKDFYSELPLKIELEGTYHQLGEFVSLVSGLSRIVTLHDFQIKRNESGVLFMTIDGKTYRYESDEEE